MKRRWISTPWTAEKNNYTNHDPKLFKTIRNKSLRYLSNEWNQLVVLFTQLIICAYELTSHNIFSSSASNLDIHNLTYFQIQNNKFLLKRLSDDFETWWDSRYNGNRLYFVVKCGKINKENAFGNFISVISLIYPITIHIFDPIEHGG
jgi:hypothetical protein